MWNRLTLVWQHTRSQWLVGALIVSALLHVLFIGEIGFTLPDLTAKPHRIEAQLVLTPPVVPTKTFKPLAPRLSDNKKSKEKPPVLAPPSPVNLAPPNPSALDSPIAAEPLLTAASNVTNDVVDDTASAAASEAIASAAEAAEQLQTNANAYHYVQTKFDVRTDINAAFDSSPVGAAVMLFERSADGERYHLNSVMQAKGLVALFIPDLLQTSDGKLVAKGLQPQHYLYQFGDKKNKTFSADFDWQAKTLRLQSVTALQELPLVDGAQDLLSFMYQFMFVPPLQNMQLAITNGKKLGIYDYSFEGEETIPTKMGQLNTIHLMRQADTGDDKTELWLAVDYQHVPVKIRKTEKKGKVYELLVTSLKTEKPATPLP